MKARKAQVNAHEYRGFHTVHGVRVEVFWSTDYHRTLAPGYYWWKREGLVAKHNWLNASSDEHGPFPTSELALRDAGAACQS